MERNIPAQVEGGFSDAVSSIKFETVAEAALHFETVKKRFLDINSWEYFAGEKKGSFSLCDENGDLVLEEPKLQYYIRIKVPFLPNSTGDSFDWVRIEYLENEGTKNSEKLYLRVRSSENPKNRNGVIAHFFKEKATSNFLIKREENIITAEVHGRNEIPNTDDLKILEEWRNAVVAKGASVIGSKIQWKSFTDGLIKRNEK